MPIISIIQSNFVFRTSLGVQNLTRNWTNEVDLTKYLTDGGAATIENTIATITGSLLKKTMLPGPTSKIYVTAS